MDRMPRLWSLPEGAYRELGFPPVRVAPESLAASPRVRWSPDGRLIAMMAEWDLQSVWDVRSGEAVHLESSDPPSTLRWGSNSREISVFRTTGMVVTYQIEFPRPDTGFQAAHTQTISSLAMTHDGSRALTSSEVDGTVRLWTQAERAEPTLVESRAEHADLSSDGMWAAVIDEEGLVSVVSAADGRARVLGAHPEESRVLDWEVLKFFMQRLFQISLNSRQVAWSPDCQTIMSTALWGRAMVLLNVADGAVRTVDLGLGGRGRCSPRTSSTAAEWSPEGQYAAILAQSLVVDVELLAGVLGTASATSDAVPKVIGSVGQDIRVCNVRDGSVAVLPFREKLAERELELTKVFLVVIEESVDLRMSGLATSPAFAPDGFSIAVGGMGPACIDGSALRGRGRGGGNFGSWARTASCRRWRGVQTASSCARPRKRGLCRSWA